jgi:hypothetical protein
MSANELAYRLDELDKKIMVKGLRPNDLLSAELCDQSASMLRQQDKQLTLSGKVNQDLVKLVNELNAEIEALKNNMNTATNELLQKQDEIEALKAERKELINVCTVFEDYLNGSTAWTQEQVDNLNEQVVAILRKAQE